jgi:hypothetical protein
MIFKPDAYTYAPVTPFVDGMQGNLYVYAYAHDALTAKTPYYVILNEFGHITAAQSATAIYCYVGVPNDTYAAGDLAKLQIGGYCASVICASDDYTIGYGVKAVGGALACTDADYTGAVGEFAASAETGTTLTDVNLMLCGHMVLTAAS